MIRRKGLRDTMQEMLEVLQNQYEKDNFIVQHNDNQNGFAYIYCSSNALYEKNNLTSFRDRVIVGDRYEWFNLRAACKPELEIFIRDIWLSWYVKGINSRINSYEKLIELMRSLTQGYTVRCVGASSGGYIGTILAMELNADISYSFAGQFSLRNHFDHLQKNPFLREYLLQNGDQYFEYYKKIPETKVSVVYMYPTRSEQDHEQYMLVKGMKQLFTVKVDVNEHGVAIYPFAIPRYLSFNLEEVEKMVAGGSSSKLKTSIRIGGWNNFLKWAARRIIKTKI